MKNTLLVLVAFAVATPLCAQHGIQPQGVDVGATMKANFDYVGKMVVQSAADMPEADYAFKPTPEVRSFGQLLGHIADANYMLCATALGQASPSEGVEKTMTAKADLEKELAASYEYCQPVFALSQEELAAKVTLFGREYTRLGAVLIGLSHNWEHYGNLVTYLRMKGHVPPSSKPARM